MVLHVGRDLGKLFYLRMFMHNSRETSAEIAPDMQTCGLRERLWVRIPCAASVALLSPRDCFEPPLEIRSPARQMFGPSVYHSFCLILSAHFPCVHSSKQSEKKKL